MEGYAGSTVGPSTFGLPIELVSAGEALERFPLMDATGVLGGVWLPTDGYLDPSGLTYAFLGGARSRGVTVEARSPRH